MNDLKKSYLWGLNMKSFMGFYFTAIVFFCGVVTAFFGGDSLRLTALLEMLVTSLAIALFQFFILPDEIDLTGGLLIGRTLLFAFVSAAVSGLASLWGGWFAPHGAGVCLLFGCVMLVGFFSILLGIRFRQEEDTRRLNDSLIRYQKNHSA